MLLYRLFGVALAIGGAALLLFVSFALYTRTDAGPAILVHLGMPAALLTTLIGAFIVGLGVWLAGFAHPTHGPDGAGTAPRR